MAEESKKKKKKCKNEGGHGGGGGGHDAAGGLRWLLTYADMITLLLGLFIILYALSSQEEAKIQELAQGLQIAFGTYSPAAASTGAGEHAEGPPNRAPRADYKALWQQVSTISKNQDGYAAKITQDQRGVVISLSDRVLFESDSDVITPAGKSTLDELAVLLNQPMVRDHQIAVEAHTDDLDTKLHEDNWDLSAKRSINTIRYLTQGGTGMIDPKRIRGTFFGEYHPKVLNTNRSPEERAENRRVEIVILHTPDMQQEFYRHQARQKLLNSNGQ